VVRTGAIDVVQPDISHDGGIGESLRIASYAEVYNVQVAPHNLYGPVALAASAHACFCMPNFLILEHCRYRPWFDEVQEFGPTVQDGHVVLSDRPGLGIALNWDYVKKHPYERRPLRIFTNQDGGIPFL